MNYLISIIFSIFFLASCGLKQDPDFAKTDYGDLKTALHADITGSEKVIDDKDYKKIDRILEGISEEIESENILKSDILRGWYRTRSESDKKYGTPDSWIFIKEASGGKWMSPNAFDEDEILNEKDLCKKTAGIYHNSCLESSDSDCEYVSENYCQCTRTSKWKEGQGCILMSERGTYVAINSLELKQGWYYGLLNEKKLNTPTDWVWSENAKRSIWKK